MDDGGLGIRNWGGYYDHQPAVKNLGLNLMGTVEGDTKPLLPGAAFLPDHSAVAMPQYTSWVRPRDGGRFLHAAPNFALPVLHPPEPALISAEPVSRKDPSPPQKKRPHAPPRKAKKPPQPKKPSSSSSSSSSRSRGARKSSAIVINGINLDISGLPTPVCSCTGAPQQCYRWGIGGWQSACCTTSVSMYPLPMSPKRRGARIAGRKMSQGAFKKVLEKLAGEGYNLGNPIDLNGHWAKHGTNKYVTIR